MQYYWWQSLHHVDHTARAQTYKHPHSKLKRLETACVYETLLYKSLKACCNKIVTVLLV